MSKTKTGDLLVRKANASCDAMGRKRHAELNDAVCSLLLWLTILLGILSLLSSFVESAAKGAPAPKKAAPPKRPPIDAAVAMEWNGTKAPVRFEKSGAFWCYWLDEDWHGTWALKDGVLTVRESRNAFDPAPSWLVWKVKLVAGKWKSVSGNSPSFELFPFTARKFD